MSKRTEYFTLGTALLVVTGIVTAINVGLYDRPASPTHPYSFWTSREMWVAYGIALVAVLLFAAGFRGWMFPPWKRTSFPDLEIEINQTQHRGYPLGTSSDLWVSFAIRVTSHESDQNASLTFRYRARLDPATEYGRKFGESLFHGDTNKDQPPDIPTDWLAQPLNVLPQHSYGGFYVAKIDHNWRGTLATPLEESLLVEEHNSKQAVVIPAQVGLYKSTNWKAPSKEPSGYWTVYPATDDVASSEEIPSL